MKKQFKTFDEVKACVGQDVASSPWFSVTQEQINLFAQATNDHQWIHIDKDKAAAGPFGTTIARTFPPLSLHSPRCRTYPLLP